MIKLVLTALFMILFSLSPAQNLIEETNKKIEIYLENAARVKTLTKEVNGGERSITSFNNSDIIQLKTNENGIEKKVRWFFNNDTLFYSDKIWTKISTNKVVDEEKLYLQKMKLQAWLTADERSVNPNSEEFIKLNTELANYAHSLLKQMQE